MKTTHRIPLLALCAALSALGLQAQTAGSGNPGGATPPAPPAPVGNTTPPPPAPVVPPGKGPAENASPTAKAVHKVIADFQTQRDQYLTQRKTLLEQLKTANDAERKTILEQLRTENEKRAEEERVLGKQIRDELKRLREERKTTGG